METTILVYKLNKHRCNVQEANCLETALKELGYKVTRDKTKPYDLAFVWAPYSEEDKEELNNFNIGGITLCMYVDKDLPYPRSNVTLVSQFTDIGDVFFPVSSLAVFHKYWDKPIKTDKIFNHIYGGTFKERRDYSPLLNYKESVILGDSEEWDNYSSLRIPAIRDLDVMYHFMAMAKETSILYDEKYTDLTTTLRFYECVFTDTILNVYDKDGKVTRYYPEDIRKTTNKNVILRQLKDLVERYTNGK